MSRTHNAILLAADENAPGGRLTISNIANISALYKTFPPVEARRIARKLEIHHTPEHGSWLDIAEIGINIITREYLDRRIPNKETLRNELREWNDAYNGNSSPVN